MQLKQVEFSLRLRACHGRGQFPGSWQDEESFVGNVEKRGQRSEVGGGGTLDWVL